MAEPKSKRKRNFAKNKKKSKPGFLNPKHVQYLVEPLFDYDDDDSDEDFDGDEDEVDFKKFVDRKSMVEFLQRKAVNESIAKYNIYEVKQVLKPNVTKRITIKLEKK